MSEEIATVVKSTNTFEKVGLYLLSLWLLFVLIVILTVNIPIYFGKDAAFIGLDKLILTNIVPCISLLFVLIGTVFYLTFDYRLAGSSELPFEIGDVENANYEHLTFLATYIIPLICFNFAEPRYLIVLAIVLICIGVIYVKTNIFYANPTLALLGFHIYRVASVAGETEKKIIVICKVHLKKGEMISTLRLDENIYFARRMK